MDENILYIAAVALAFVLIFLNSKKLKTLRRGGSVSTITTEDAKKYHDYLSVAFQPYKQLSFEDRKKFLQRLHDFITTKTYVGQGTFKITDDIKISIAAQAILLTLNLKRYLLPEYETIYVFETSFAPSPESAMASASQKGRIAFSWPDFKLGIAKSNAFNAGAYQVAHALEMSVFSGNEARELKSRLVQWKQSSDTGVTTLRSSDKIDWNGFSPDQLTRDFPLVAGLYFGATPTLQQNFPEIYRSFNTLIRS